MIPKARGKPISVCPSEEYLVTGEGVLSRTSQLFRIQLDLMLLWSMYSIATSAKIWMPSCTRTHSLPFLCTPHLFQGARGCICSSHHCNPTPAHIWLLGSAKWNSDYCRLHSERLCRTQGELGLRRPLRLKYMAWLPVATQGIFPREHFIENIFITKYWKLVMMSFTCEL